MFKKLYNKVLVWAANPLALRFLMVLSFIEAFFFPVPPDVMLAPMTMSKPHKAWEFALITTICSVIGGIIGYCLGFWAYNVIVQPVLEIFGKQQAYDQALLWFNAWGILVVMLAAFTPVPFKIITISAGAMQLNLPLFILATIFSRGVRFFSVCGLFKYGNKYFANWIEEWINVIGWSVLLSLASIIIAYYFFF